MTYCWVGTYSVIRLALLALIIVMLVFASLA